MILPGVDVAGYRRRARRGRRRRRAERGDSAPARSAAAAVHARARLPARPRRSTPSCSSSRRICWTTPSRWTTSAGRCSRRSLVAAVSVFLEVIFGTNDDDTYTLRVVQRIARRQGGGDPNRRSRDHLPRDRRARAPRAPAGDAGRERAEHGPLARRGHARADRVGDRPLLADRREPGRDPARLERRHPRVPLGRQGERHADGVLGARRLRAHRARARDGHRPARRRRLEPRQPALGRGRGGDPHRQPHGGREAREPRLPRVLRQRVQRHALARRCSAGRSSSSGLPRCARSAATCGRAATAAASTRSCAPRCA